MNQQRLQFLNQAFAALIPKKPNTKRLSDFRLISLIHSFGKVISKLLANRLAPVLGKLVSYNQNAFIKKRCIHDNFMFVQQVSKDLHKKKVMTLFIKLDISKTFDTVNWSYLIDIMSYLGFGQRWMNWISTLWATSSCFLLNGEPGKRIGHCRGVRQGDPLSLLLFILTMELFHMLFKYAQSSANLGFLHKNYANFRMSLYIDDMIVFINPTAHDYAMTKHILQLFGDAYNLITNLEEREYYPIRCGELNMEENLGVEHTISSFPCMYLGLPLHFRKASQKHDSANGGENWETIAKLEEETALLPGARAADKISANWHSQSFSHNA
jgi:hypothetical protein